MRLIDEYIPISGQVPNLPDTKALQPAAHTPRVPGGEWHDLATHLHATAAKAKARADKFGAGDLAYLAGLIHDYGKFNPAFQQYLRDADAGRSAKSVQHAVHGALLARDSGVPWVMQPIYGHHSQMPSGNDIKDAFANPETLEAYEKVRIAAEASGWKINPPSSLDHPDFDLRGEMLLRMVFSCLVDSDYIDTEKHFDPERSKARTLGPSPSVLLPVLLASQENIMLGKTGTVNEARREVYEYSLKAAKMERGVFRLSAPTGAGKTRSAMTFGLMHAVEHKLDRVIFAVPYLSITDQTASVTRNIFGDEAVLEHHSGVLAREPSERSKLAVQNWDAPFIVTTTVQLLESLLSNRPRRCRKLHNIARSVIILDEAQTLPVRMLQPIVSVLDELIQRYGCSVVLSTATQPALETNSRYLEGFKDVRDIVPENKAREHFQLLKRVRYEVEPQPWSWDQVASELCGERQAMVVVNTRRDAQELHSATGGDALHLSASMCGAHRTDIVEEVRRRLAADDECRLISTQVVEAGVDLDFDVVLRAFGPLDSIVQAAGRCNREGRLTEGRVVVFKPSEGGKLPGKDYSTATYTASNMLRRGTDLHDPGVFRSYFEKMYQLGTDEKGIQALRKKCNYPEVASKFRIIDEDAGQDVIILYDSKVRALVDRVRSEGELRPGDLKKLQPYAVGLLSKQFERESAKTEEIVEGVFVWRGEYDDMRGLELREEEA